ncbi:MAG: hypothetical protein E7616_01345 [Ruminococcaceae bacterium]|nr:hypothetical protein [Oscillospiraceae bacterium]
MKRMLAMTAMLLCMITVFTSCGGYLKFSKAIEVNSYEEPAASLTEAAKIDVEGELSYSATAGNLVVFEKTDDAGNTTISVYNMATNAVVWTGATSKTESTGTRSTVTYTVKAVEQCDVSWFYVVKTTTTEKENEDPVTDALISMFNEKGELIVESNAKGVKVPDVELDLVRFDGKIFRVTAKKGVKEAFAYSELNAELNLDSKAGGYYIAESEYKGFTVYNSKLKAVVAYECPSYAENFKYFPLNNGNVLVQYVINNGEYAEDYTYIEDGEKKTLVSVLVNVKKGTTKEIELDFVVSGLVIRDTVDADSSEWKEMGVSKDIENLAAVFMIDNEHLDRSIATAELVTLTNKAKIDDMIGGYVSGMIPSLEMVSMNRWEVSNNAGQKFLLNHKGTVLGETTNATGRGTLGFIYNGKLYNWSLEVVLDMNEYEPSEINMFTRSLVFVAKSGETMIYANNEVKTLIAKEEEKSYRRINSGIFMIKTGENKYELYNDIGEVIYTSDSTIEDIEIAVTGNNVVILRIEQTVKGKTESFYLRLA